ncbi:MAG: POTRA domain-containing protein [Vicinamibacterales bacterium]
MLRRRLKDIATIARCIGAVVLLAVLPEPAAADLVDYLGKPIVSVEFDVRGRDMDDAPLLALVDTQPGGVLSMRSVRESVAHLGSIGQFDNVIVHAEARTGGVALVYQLAPAQIIGGIDFNGLPGDSGVSAGNLRRDIEDRFGPSPPPDSGQDIAALVQEQLRVRGYLSARVAAGVRPDEGGGAGRIQLEIAPGPRARIRTIAIDEAPGVPPGALRGRLDLDVGDPYMPNELSTRIEAYLTDRREAGHYEARVTLEARFEDNDSAVALSFTVVDGPRFLVRFAGDPLPDDDREALVPIATERAADLDLLEDSTIRIQEYLQSRGYRDATAPYAIERSAQETVIVFMVTRGLLYRISDVEVAGNVSVPMDPLRAQLRLQPGQPLDPVVLDGDVAAVEEVYRRQGFAGVTVRSGIDAVDTGSSLSGETNVIVRILIQEGVRTEVASVRINGAEGLSESDLRMSAGLAAGEPFVLADMAVGRDALEQYLRNQGYERATVTADPGLSDDGTRADVVFEVVEGPQLRVDHVIIIGNRRTRTDTIAQQVTLGSGDPLDAGAILESQRRLAALGLFRRVRITPLAHDDETTRDLLVTVEEAPVTTLGYGGGLEAGQETTAEEGGTAGDRIEIRPRAFFEIGRRNLFGKNRSISLFTRLSFRSAVSPGAPGEGDSGGSPFGFVEYRVLGTFREPAVFGSNADAFLSGTAEQQRRPSFSFTRRAFSAEVARALGSRFGLSGNYQIQRTQLFDERFTEDVRLIDRLFPQVRLSSFSTSAVRDTRDDQLNPTSGHYASVNVQLAARRIGSEVGFVRSFLTGQWFRQLPGRSGVVVATSARVGLADGFQRVVTRRDGTGSPILGPDGQPIVDVVDDLPASERFFAGGDTTVRGFALDQLGTPATLAEDGFPLGGNAVAIFNAELRVPLFGGLGVVGFVDGGNVFARTSDFDLGELRGAVGFGVRYASPVGPIRVDLGFKTDRRNLASGKPERLTALHVSLGQAF